MSPAAATLPRLLVTAACAVVATSGAVAAQQAAGAAEDAALSPATPAVDAQRRELAARLERLFDDPYLARSHVGLMVQSASTGAVVFERAAERRFTAASSSKLVTGAVALHRLGPDYRWSTRLAAVAGPRDGALPGGLWIVGDGDPGIGRDRLAAWVGTLRREGVRRIAGDVIGDDRAFGGAPWGAGWAWEDLHVGWGAGVSGLWLSPGRVRATLLPGSSPGEPALLEFADDEPPLPLLHSVRTGPPGSEVRLHWRPAGDGRSPHLVGWIPADRDRLPLTLAPPHPTLHLLDRLAAVLADSGIVVEGPFRLADEGESAPEPPGWSVAFPSDSLGAAVERMLKSSDNQVAEALLRTLGREFGDGSPEAGLAAVRETLGYWGIGPDAISLADGSGLSRYNEVSPAGVVRLLRRVRQLPEGAAFEAALPVAGVDGTLGRRLGGTTGEGRVRAKTGSLSGVRALAGFVEDARGDTLIFALHLNGYHAPDSVARALEDLLVEQLALYRGPGYPEPGAATDDDARSEGGTEP